MPARLRALLVAVSVLVVAVTSVLWARSVLAPTRDGDEASTAARRARFKIWNTPLEAGRCAISVAQFGGLRARLVRAEHAGTIHFAVIETPPRPTPLDVLRQGDWLKLKFGDAETTTLGTYGSTKAAMARASRLCPARLRCLPGRPGCADHPVLPNPLQMYGPAMLPGSAAPLVQDGK
jgi:hypothetical protein